MGQAAPTATQLPQMPPEKYTDPSVTSNDDAKSKCPVSGNKSTQNSLNSQESYCPMKPKYKNPTQYNVYSQKLDPTNNMPTTANQQPAPNQTIPLPVDRVASTIPKAGTDDSTWTYPSPQMFWNALVRKGKTEGAEEKDMDTVVAIHNNMNENTWKQVLYWEELHPAASTDKVPKLLKFTGRPDEYSPKARLKMLFGHPAPFDRHDWTIDRGGAEVRYVIDYYHDESAVEADQRPKDLLDAHSMKSIKVDVRPALDSPQALIDRLISMPYLQFFGTTGYRPPPFFVRSEVQLAEERKMRVLRDYWSQIQNKCAAHKDKLQSCDSDESCGAAAVALRRCTASVVCPSMTQDFDACIAAKPVDTEKLEAIYKNMDGCLDLFKVDSAKYLKK